MVRKRRSHTKSHHGCLQCRNRRVKCDEARPACKNCERRDQTCFFTRGSSPWIFVKGIDFRSALHGNVDPPPSQHAEQLGKIQLAPKDALPSSEITNDRSYQLHANKKHNASCISPRGPQGSSHTTGKGPKVDHLGLMSHFKDHVVQSLSPDSNGLPGKDVKETWNEVAPRLAMSHPVLLHSMLAVSALHWVLATQEGTIYDKIAQVPSFPDSKEEMTGLGIRYHLQAVSLLRGVLQQPLTEERRLPLFLAAILIALHEFSFSLVATTDASTMSKSDHDLSAILLKLMALLHGTTPIVQPIETTVLSTPLRALMPPAPENVNSPLSFEQDKLFHALEAFHTTTLADTATDRDGVEEDYSRAIYLLRQTYILQREVSNRQKAIVLFAVHVPKRLLADLADSQALALCIVASYAVAIHNLRHHIWVQGQARSILHSIYRKVDRDEATEIIRLCMKMTEDEN